MCAGAGGGLLRPAAITATATTTIRMNGISHVHRLVLPVSPSNGGGAAAGGCSTAAPGGAACGLASAAVSAGGGPSVGAVQPGGAAVVAPAYVNRNVPFTASPSEATDWYVSAYGPFSGQCETFTIAGKPVW
jgi:hypothetical protein